MVVGTPGLFSRTAREMVDFAAGLCTGSNAVAAVVAAGAAAVVPRSIGGGSPNGSATQS